MVSDKGSVSLLARKLGHYASLDANDLQLLSKLDTAPRNFPRNTEIMASGAPLETIHIVRAGWLMNYTILPDGRRQVLQIFLPGDIIGLADITIGHTSYDLKTLTECTLSQCSIEDVHNVVRQSSRLAALLFGHIMVSHTICMDRLKVLGRMNARERVAHFLLTILTQLRVVNPAMTDNFELPLTQFDLADAVGLTNVSVSNALSMMQEQKILRRSSGRMHILDEARLREMANFVDRHKRFDLSWLPATA